MSAEITPEHQEPTTAADNQPPPLCTTAAAILNQLPPESTSTTEMHNQPPPFLDQTPPTPTAAADILDQIPPQTIASAEIHNEAPQQPQNQNAAQFDQDKQPPCRSCQRQKQKCSSKCKLARYFPRTMKKNDFVILDKWLTIKNLQLIANSRYSDDEKKKFIHDLVEVVKKIEDRTIGSLLALETRVATLEEENRLLKEQLKTHDVDIQLEAQDTMQDDNVDVHEVPFEIGYQDSTVSNEYDANESQVQDVMLHNHNTNVVGEVKDSPLENGDEVIGGDQEEEGKVLMGDVVIVEGDNTPFKVESNKRQKLAIRKRVLQE